MQTTRKFGVIGKKTVTILILGSLDDEHACYVLEVLRERNFDAELVDSEWFPSDLRISYDPAQQTGILHLPTGRRLSWSEIRSVYWRCYNSVQTPDIDDFEQAYVASNDSRGLFESFLIQLPARWVNGWNAFQMHQTKPVQLAKVAELGVPIPATLLSNDATSIREFVELHPNCIFKPVQGGAHTRRVTEEHLTDENLTRLEYCPVTIQEEIPGTNIRVFIAGEQVHACEVRTESIDFRDDADAHIEVHDLPNEVAQWCQKSARALELLWTGIDLRMTPEGEYHFLEANPSPMFMGFEEYSGLPLTDALLELLTEDDLK